MIVASCLVVPLWAQNANEAILPPVPHWSGKSRALALAPDHLWATPFEKGGMRTSPSHKDTMAWLDKLDAASDQLAMINIGQSLQGRRLSVVIASKEGVNDAAGLRANGKPTLFAHAGIHAGEIDGKDAGMMLLRDLTVTGKLSHLLDKVNFLFLPILSADGHEDASPFNRINQRGPEVMGWRTNGRNLNLNRDFTKLETAGLKALIPFLVQFDPDLYFDIHVTDGIDYQYDITYGFIGTYGYSPAGAAWMNDHLRPFMDKALDKAGHIPGDLIFAKDNSDISKGLSGFAPSPRFSNSYGDLRHLPTVLVENHSLKPYDQRVLGTYVMLTAALDVLGQQGKSLRKAIEADRARRPETVPTAFAQSGTEMIDFLGIKYEKHNSEISGSQYVRWLGEPVTLRIPKETLTKATTEVRRPKGYYVPADWPEIIAKLRMHGIELTMLTQPKTAEVVMYRFGQAKLASAPFEGRVRVTAPSVVERRTLSFPVGSAYVSTDQPLGELIVMLLEPVSTDSFWQWGYFLEILQVTEYFEAYALEPLATKMLAEDKSLALTFQEQVDTDPDFARNSRERLNYFYQRSQYADRHWRLYPIARDE